MKYELTDLPDERTDINLWRATLDDGRTVDVDAPTEKEAREKIDAALKEFAESETPQTESLVEKSDDDSDEKSE